MFMRLISSLYIYISVLLVLMNKDLKHLSSLAVSFKKEISRLFLSWEM